MSGEWKGGRHERLHTRINEDDKAWLLRHCKAHGISVADWLEARISVQRHLEAMIIDMFYVEVEPGHYIPVLPSEDDFGKTLDNQDDL
jgi:hypothetical protein